MISHEHKCIFVHIIQTNCTQIEGWIQGRDQWEIQPNMKHITARKAKWEYSQYWDEYFKFSFVRNPYEKIISELNSNVSAMYHGYLTPNENPSERLLNLDVRNYYDVHCVGGALINDFWTEWDVLTPNCVYKNINQEMDKIYKYEEWDSACEDISQRLGIEKPFEKFVPEPAGKYTIKDLTQSDIELINTMFYHDFEEYGYEMIPSNILW